MTLNWEPIPGENARQAIFARTEDGQRVEAIVMRRQRNAGVWKWMLRINGRVELKFIHGMDTAKAAAEYLIEEREKGPDSYDKALLALQAAAQHGTLESSLLSLRSGFSRS